MRMHRQVIFLLLFFCTVACQISLMSLYIFAFICLKGSKQEFFSLSPLDLLPPDRQQVLDISCKLSLFKLILWSVSPVSNITYHCASGVAAGGFCFPLLCVP